MIRFNAPYTLKRFVTTGNIVLSLFCILSVTVANALEFLAFTNRILTTDLSQSHCNFKSPMKSSLSNSFLAISAAANSTDSTPQLSTTVLYSYSVSATVVYSHSNTPQVKVTLRLTASQSVNLGVEPPSGAHDQIFFTV
jgi:hypothetical protein